MERDILLILVTLMASLPIGVLSGLFVLFITKKMRMNRVPALIATVAVSSLTIISVSYMLLKAEFDISFPEVTMVLVLIIIFCVTLEVIWGVVHKFPPSQLLVGNIFFGSCLLFFSFSIQDDYFIYIVTVFMLLSLYLVYNSK